MMSENSEILISFIIPVFNGEKYIGTALQSVLKEKTVPLEVIVINDGSEDGTAKILAEAAENDIRLVICQTANRGQGAARNLGVDKAKGKYIFFLDADDTVIWIGIQQMLCEAENDCQDIVCGNYNIISASGVSEGISGVNSGKVIRDDIPCSLYQQIKNESVFGYCWNKLYRKDFLQENRIQMTGNKDVYMEDALFNLEAFSHNPKYYFLNVPVYNYNLRQETTSHREDSKMAEKCIRMLRMYGEYLKNNQCWEENLDLFVPLAMRQFCWAIFNSAGAENSCREKLRILVELFMDERCFQEMIKDKQNRKFLQRVISPTQRVMYLWCFDQMNQGQYNFLTTVFVVLNPAMRIYAKSWRKI